MARKNKLPSSGAVEGGISGVLAGGDPGAARAGKRGPAVPGYVKPSMPKPKGKGYHVGHTGQESGPVHAGKRGKVAGE